MSPRTQRIIDWLQTNQTVADIARIEGVSPQRVRQIDLRYGIRKPKRQPLFSRDEIKTIIGRHVNAIS